MIKMEIVNINNEIIQEPTFIYVLVTTPKRVQKFKQIKTEVINQREDVKTQKLIKTNIIKSSKYNAYYLIKLNRSNKIIGILGYERESKRTEVITQFGIITPFRGIGLSKQILKDVIEHFKDTKIKKLRIYLRIEEKRMKYIVKELGFEEDTSQKYYYNKVSPEEGVCYTYTY